MQWPLENKTWTKPEIQQRDEDHYTMREWTKYRCWDGETQLKNTTESFNVSSNWAEDNIYELPDRLFAPLQTGHKRKDHEKEW